MLTRLSLVTTAGLSCATRLDSALMMSELEEASLESLQLASQLEQVTSCGADVDVCTYCRLDTEGDNEISL